MTHEVASGTRAFKNVGYFMTPNQTNRPLESLAEKLPTPEKSPVTPKVPHNYSEPLWKRNLGKTVRHKKIGNVERAKGGRY